MDYRVFLVRPPGTGVRPVKGVTRILRVLEHGISISPVLPSTNGTATEYSYERISNVLPSPEDDLELKFDVFNSNGRADTLKFSCDSRSALLTALLNKLDDVDSSGIDFPLKKHSHQRGGLVDTVLRVRSASIVKMINTGVRQERRKTNPAKKMNLIDILRVEVLSDDEHVVLLYFKSRIMRLSLKDISPFLQSVQQNMKRYLNKNIEILKISSSVMVDNISAFVRKTVSYPILYSFQAMKKIDTRKEERPRIVSITKEHLLERNGDEVTALYSLKDVVGIVVKEDHPEEVVIEFKSWRPTQYIIKERDHFLASMADVMESARLLSFSIHLEEFMPHMFPEKPHHLYQNECEQYYSNQLLAVADAKDHDNLQNTLKEYACNISVGDSQCADSRVLKKVTEVLKSSGGNFSLATCCCLVLQRMLASRSCFEAVKNMPEVSLALIQCMHSGNFVLSYLATATIRAALRLLNETPAMDTTSISKLELANKGVFLSAENMQQLTSLLHTFALANETALQLYGILQTFLFAVSSPTYEMDSGRGWTKTFEGCIIGAAGILCNLCRRKSAVVHRSNSLFLKALLTQASPPIASQLQKVCLDRGIMLIYLKDAIFATDEEARSMSGNLVYLMIEGNKGSKKLFEALLPKGIMHLYTTKVVQMSMQREDSGNRFSAWMEILDLLRKDNFVTPVLVWNDVKRMELKKYLQDEVEAFYAVAENNKDLLFNSSEVQLTYLSANEGAGSVVDGVHLELLVDRHPATNDRRIEFWKLRDPLSTFEAVLQAMVLGFTPLFGQNNLPEVDLRLAAHVLSWIYERHAEDIQHYLGRLNVIEIIVGMLREVIESEPQVFVFKLVVFLLATVEIGGKDNALRVLSAGGATIIVPLIVLSLSKCCRDKYAFECDAWNMGDQKYSRSHETVLVKNSDGQIRTVRVPSGRFYEVLDKAVQDGSLDAKEGVHWQDDSVHEKLQLGLALDLLEAIMRLSGIDSNTEEFPPPIACSHLSKEELLCHLVQILLWAKGSVFGRILDILAYVVRVNSAAMNRLYKLGAFEILLWKLLAGDLVASDKACIVGFIRQCHLLQDPDSVFNGPDYLKAEEQFPWHGSILRLFFPEGVILKMMSEGADSFTSILNSEHESPEMIWTAEMREHLLEHLKAELEPYVKFRASDPLALYIHVPKAPLVYPELSESVFVAPFYVENLLDVERFPNYQINDPVTFLNSLALDLRKCAANLVNAGPTTSSTSMLRKELSRIHLLLRAQVYLVQRFPELPLPSDMESVVITLATPSLRTCLTQKDESPPAVVDIIVQATTILRHYCRGMIRDLEVPQTSLHFALSVLSLSTNLDDNEASSQELKISMAFESALGGALLVLGTIASSRAGKEQLWEDIRWKKGFWCTLISAAADAMAIPSRGPSPVTFSALSCLKYFAEDSVFCDRVLKEGWYLPLLLLAIPSADIALKSHNSKSAVLYSSADVLGSLVRALMKASSPFGTQTHESIYGVMSRLIPRPLLACLLQEEGPEKFITAVSSEFMHPEGIWTCDMRSELLEGVQDRLQHHSGGLVAGNSLMNDEIEWLQGFEYECLKGEVRAEGLFVRGLSSNSWEGFALPAGHSYIDVMQNYLQLHKAELLVAATEEIEVPVESYPNEKEDHEAVSDMEDLDEVERTKLEEVEKTDLEEVEKTSDFPPMPTIAANHEQGSGPVENCLYTLSALRECLKHAVKEGRDDIIMHFRYSILSDIVLSGHSREEVQIELASIVKALADCKVGQDVVLNSDLMKSLALQLWQSAAESNDQVLMSTLEAVLLLTESISATVKATNIFSSCGLLLPVMAIFAKISLPSLFKEQPIEGKNMAATQIPKAGQLWAAQILGQLLLAGSGISRRTKLVKDLTFWRTGSNASDPRHAIPVEGIEEATDMYELLNIIEQGVEEKVDPLVLKTMVLLFPIDFLTLLAREPSKACDLYERQHRSPRLVWDEGTRLRLKSRIEKEALQLRDKFVNEGLSAVPSWAMMQGHPVFLRWTVANVVENDSRPLYRDSEDVDYSRELYLGGFYIDQFLRNPEFDFGIALEERFLREVRKAIVMGRVNGQKLDFDDRRRLLLSLLLLFKLRPPLLLRHSNFDIFFPVFEFISGGSSRERRGLTQVAILLFHCIATHSDIADCMSSEDLMHTLASLLDLRVPASVAGFTGTDPRLCSLMLMLRLSRLSSTAVEVALQLNIVSKLAKLVDNNVDVALQQRAGECLAVMSADKRRGGEVLKLLSKLISKERKALAAWNIPTSDIRDEIVDSKTLKHFLQQRYPSSWWVSDSSDGFNESDTEEYAGPVTIVEASLTYPGGKLS
eukprot:c23944_g1_i1 orf=785-7753(-)